MMSDGQAQSADPPESTHGQGTEGRLDKTLNEHARLSGEPRRGSAGLDRPSGARAPIPSSVAGGALGACAGAAGWQESNP